MTLRCELSMDFERAELFERKLQQTINQGSLSLMICVGHRTRLFECMSQVDHVTSQEIAERAELFEPYVCHWLTVMVRAGIVEYDSMFKTYRLPPEHSAFLTGALGFNNYASHMQWLSILGKLEDEIVKCFQQGGEVPFSLFADLQTEMAVEQSESVINGLFKYVLPLVPSLIMRLCEGLDVLDLNCGDGSTLMELATAFPKSRFVGYDSSNDLIMQANQTAKERGIENVIFFTQDISEIRAINSFDLIMAFDVMYTQTYPAQVLDEAYTALRPGGIILMRDIATSGQFKSDCENPLAMFLDTIACMRSASVSAKPGFGPTMTDWETETICQTMEDIGYENIEVHALPHDLLNHFYLGTKLVP